MCVVCVCCVCVAVCRFGMRIASSPNCGGPVPPTKNAVTERTTQTHTRQEHNNREQIKTHTHRVKVSNYLSGMLFCMLLLSFVLQSRFIVLSCNNFESTDQRDIAKTEEHNNHACITTSNSASTHHGNKRYMENAGDRGGGCGNGASLGEKMNPCRLLG